MKLNEIKKSLYKAKPTAILSFTDINHVEYIARLGNRTVKFSIPIEESNFEEKVPAQLLIRWIKEFK